MENKLQELTQKLYTVGVEKAKNEEIKIFIALYFEYPLTEGTSGYGMISEYNPKMNGFVHKDMWVAGKNTL